MSQYDIQDWVRTKLWDNVPVSISVIDRDYNIVEANRAFTEAYGAWHEKPCYAVYKGRDRKCENCGAALTFADGMMRVRSEEGVVKNGSPTWYLVHLLPLVRKNGEIPYVVEMSTDITAMRLLEQEKLEAERLAVVGQTVAGLAHGVKNLLMGLDGGMYMTRTGIQNGKVERMLEGWQILEENVARISAFVREFLDFARGHEPTVEIVDPNRPARQVIELFAETARLSGVDLEADLDDSLEAAPLDPEGIHTCLANLVSNALDACEASDKEHHVVRLRTYDEDDTIVYEVTDDGVGMDYEVKRKVFTNFFSTKATGKGTGLGLLTTRKIAQEHGGTVSVESDWGQGSVFTIRLPRKRLPRLSGANGDPRHSDRHMG